MSKKVTAKDLANAVINRMTRLMIWLRLSCQYRFGLLKGYQPNPFKKASIGAAESRLCADRFEAFSQILPKDSFSFMDLGCNSGYFVFRLAERGGFGIGIEMGRNENMVSQSLAGLHRVRNVAFSRQCISPENVAFLPSVDVVVFMSLFHHFVRYYGRDGALDMLRIIAGKAGRFLVFETGQPDEKSTWAKELEFMGPDSRRWMEGLLQELGFNKVYYLGVFPTSVSSVKRHLVVGERKRGHDL